MVQGYQLLQSLPLRLFRSFFNVLLKLRYFGYCYFQDEVRNTYSSVATFKKRLERQISEGVAIMKKDGQVQTDREHHILMNSKSEHKSLQPAVHRQVTVRGVRNGS